MDLETMDSLDTERMIETKFNIGFISRMVFDAIKGVIAGKEI
jgi:hypothetical protein